MPTRPVPWGPALLDSSASWGYKVDMRRIRPIALITLLAMVAESPARSQEIPYSRYRLGNGLTVILHEDNRLPLVSVNLWYYVGSKDEPPKRSGFAHLFEHLMFMGTEKVPTGQFDQRMEAGGGHNNATTSADRTNYFATGPKELLDLLLFLEADRMQGLGKAMTLEKLDVQRGVVRNERRQSYENRPYRKAELEIPGWIYPRDHPYSWPVIGSHEDLESASVSDVVNFFDGFYFARNASLVIAGDFDPDEARRLVEKYFASLASRPALRRPTVLAASLDGMLRRTLRDAVRLPLVTFAWHSPGLYADGDAELDILANVLGGGKSSRLYRRLVYEKKIAQSVDVYQYSRYLGGQFRIEILGGPGEDDIARVAGLQEIERTVDEEIARLIREGPTQREVDRARNSIETSFWRNLESLGQRADLLNRYQFYFDDPGAIGRDVKRYRDATPATVAKAAKTVLREDARLVLHVLPKQKAAGE